MKLIGLGGNVGDVRVTFERAREAIEQLGRVRSAPLYRTAAIGPVQPDYLNSVLSLQFDGQPIELLSTLLEIERLLGRDRSREVRWGPRTIDLDILVFDDRVIDTPELRVPHPRMFERRFVLEPMLELVGDISIGGRRLNEWLAAAPAEVVELVASSW
ncbi:MAG: 2-amino-4-hydroxy-6-hydroxymethyldihydropteridine diphosphokinase [Kofleriaceae bacterium]